ncbi:winged helix DNA-binding domain-containing protein [Microbacterium capsulatum]|uniref:Winged helix DNA-binding domain-containing protein n=1 Tax=Microbacterium capsulatum TaxID=3041921 RepID=A0ABU0XFQ1_9MICO|nr:winged helix DNA-binding domain-containing protein [Microbacterium sp. ASV81]MDQ4213030.1 winged helix DNA-binding domain-containing protein [Microbacterium sp. ASV81]
MTVTLDRRALSRATLERQLLLRRSDLPVIDAVRHLVGLQAQTPHSWYVGLWSRLAGFAPAQAADPLTDRTLVRIALMRSTIHLVSADDARALRPLVQPVLDRDLYRNHTHGKPVAGIDMARLVADGAELLAPAPLTNPQLGARLAERWPDRAPASLVYAIRNQVPLVQVPPRGLWGRSGPIAHTTADAWLGPDRTPPITPGRTIARYLGAFGPASVKDVQVWSGLTRLREVVDRMRPDLLTFRDENGQELFDLPDAPRPDPDMPAPPRFLYDFDNLLLSHADRSRVITDAHGQQGYRTQRPAPQILLVDGFTAADWTITREGDAATLTVRPYDRPFGTRDAAAVAEEGQALLAFTDPDAERREVVWAPRGR